MDHDTAMLVSTGAKLSGGVHRPEYGAEHVCLQPIIPVADVSSCAVSALYSMQYHA